jgi:hypothetical protein
VDDALTYLRTSVSVRHQKKHQELITYLTKHKAEIINYQARQETGKPIGSGRMEKGVDHVIGQRQKDHGMSWSDVGSKALGPGKFTNSMNRLKIMGCCSLRRSRNYLQVHKFCRGSGVSYFALRRIHGESSL